MKKDRFAVFTSESYRSGRNFHFLWGYFLSDPSLTVSSSQGWLYVSTYSELVEVPVANCSNYQSCGECVLSRDPYCAWNGRQCADMRKAGANK